jgi:hypothetical protein
VEEADLENKIQIVKAISKDLAMDFRLENCANICFTMVGFRGKRA